MAIVDIFENPARGDRIMRAVRECEALHEPVTLANMAYNLPKDFDLDADEVESALAIAHPEEEQSATGGGQMPELRVKPDGTILPDQEPDAPAAILPAEATAAEEPDAPGRATEAPPRLSREQAQEWCERAHHRHAMALVNLRIAGDEERDAKLKVGAAVLAWSQQTDGLTREAREQANIRHHLAAAQAERMRRAGYSPDARDFVQRQFQNGPRRGAVPARSMRRNIDASRMKLPSQR